MNQEIYNLIKQAVADGTPVEDVMNQVEAVVSKVKEEAEAKSKTPITDIMLDPYTIANICDKILDASGNINESALAQIIGVYMCQHGVIPDNLVDTYGDFIITINRDLESTLDAFKRLDNIKQKQKSGASERDIASTIMNDMIELLTSSFNFKHPH